MEDGRWKLEVGGGDYPISGADYNLVEDFLIVIRMGTTELAIGNSQETGRQGGNLRTEH